MYLLVPRPYLPEVEDVQLGLNILPAVVGDEGHLEEVIPHKVERFLDLGNGRLWLPVGYPLRTTPMFVGNIVRL